jgi:hypothetical protein
MRHAEKIDRLVVTLAEATNWDHPAVPDWERFLRLVYYVWNHRLPINPDELGAVLVNHGIPTCWCGKLADLFDHGRNLLMLCKHKPPAKTRRLSEPPR